jgi:uncharacterized protein
MKPVSHKPLFVFFPLAYAMSWIVWLPLYLPFFGIHGLPVLPYHHALGGLGPMAAAFIATFIFYESPGVARLLRKCLSVKPMLYVVIALVGPFVLTWVAALINALVTGDTFSISGWNKSSEFPEFNLLLFFAYNVLFFGFGEEVGWRGFALPHLQQRRNALVATLLSTIFWALWHTPLFFYRAGYTSMDIYGIVGWIFSLVTGSLLLTWLFNSSGGSVLACAIFHSTIVLITVWGILVLLIFKPRTLAGYKPKVTADAASNLSSAMSTT